MSSSITQNVAGGAPNFSPYTGRGQQLGPCASAGPSAPAFEWMLARNWSVRGEYLYVGLDSRGAASLNTNLINVDHVFGGSLSSVNVLTSARFNENIARGAVNYHF